MTQGLGLGLAHARRATQSLLARAKFEVGQLGLGVTVAAAGLILALSPRAPDVLNDARTYALALGAIGLFNVVLGAARPDFKRT